MQASGLVLFPGILLQLIMHPLRLYVTCAHNSRLFWTIVLFLLLMIMHPLRL